jgi:two-component SAPR family response regulator
MTKKVVLVDDERPALMELEFLLKQYEDVIVAGSFTNPIEAIKAIGELKPDVVFLDINMPQLLGVDAASEILDLDPAIDIVFITAFDQYAVEAFEIHALDYLLKPIGEQRFAKTMERILNRKERTLKASPEQFTIKCLGGFHAEWAGREPFKWRADKTKEIFAFLLQNRKRDISKEELLDQLWPEDDPEKAIRQLYNGIYYIRKAMEDYGVGRNMIKIDKDYHVQLGAAKLDTESFYEYGRKKGGWSIGELEAIAGHYGGMYLQGEYYPWADFEREHLESLYLKCILELAEKLMEAKEMSKAENYLLAAYQTSPYEEEITERLVFLYIESGNKNKAILHYKGYADLIGKELGVRPDFKLQKMIREIK